MRGASKTAGDSYVLLSSKFFSVKSDMPTKHSCITFCFREARLAKRTVAGINEVHETERNIFMIF